MRVVAQSISCCHELGEEVQKLKKQRMALDVFNRPENKHTPQGLAFQARMLATMPGFGAQPAVVSSACVAGGGSGATARVAAGVGDCEDDDQDGGSVVARVPKPIAASSTPANMARGAKSMETKAALADASLSAAVPIDLTFPPTMGGRASGAHAGVADDDWASGSTADHGDGNEKL